MKGEGTDNITEFVFHKMLDDEDTFENPNLLALTKAERTIRKEAKESEDRWLALLG